MQKLNGRITDELNMYGKLNPYELLEKYGSPLYVYNENILRKNCREIKKFCPYKDFVVNYSAKANSSLAIMEVIRDEGLNVDAMSPGEIYMQLKAGFKPEQIFYVCNNVSEDEMKYVIEKGIMTSVDSLSQLEMFGKINKGGEVAIRINPGIGAGHHKKVITAGSETKFGIDISYMEEVKELLKKYDVKLIGINQHIGSLFMDGDDYSESVKILLEIAKQFKDLKFVDMGGGFGVPYKKQENEKRLDLKTLGEKLLSLIESFTKDYGKALTFKIEPGRYIPCETAVLLGSVNTVKLNYSKKYIGTDIGFNVLLRPVMYDAYHEVEIYRNTEINSGKKETVTIVGNICESGDILVKDRELPEILEGDVIAVLDAGSYGHVMSSNYNNRFRPAEVMIREDGTDVLIRERDTFESLAKPYHSIFNSF